MKNNFFRWLGRGRRLTMLGCLVGCASLLGAASLQAAVTVTTLGGGSNLNKNPKYLGYSDGNTFSSALFHTPCGLAIDSTGNYLFVADRDNNAIRYLDLGAGQTWTFAVANTALVNQPVGVLVDAAYNVYVLNRGTGNNGSVVTFDNFGETVATNATGLTNAGGLTMDNLGNIYVTVSGNTVIKITPDGVRTNVATIPMAGTSLQGIVFKHNGLLAACDAGRNGIYLINPTTGLVTTNAGFHGRGDFPTNGNNVASSSTAKFFQPTGITEAGDGTLIVTDYGNNRVKVVLASGVVTNLYGVASNFWTKSYYPGWSDGTPKLPDATANNVQSRIPFGVAFAPDGSVYTSEDYYHLIRKTTGAGFVQPPPTPPAAPVITSVLTNFGTVSLTWSASATATSYNVKRSTSLGGPFTTLANTTGTTYTDTSVVNGTIYYYVVSALNAGGEGPNSVAVLAQPPLPPVPDPQIGYVDFPSTSLPVPYTSVFHPISTFDFNNDALFIIKGTIGSGTHYTYGYTTNAALVADPTSGDASIPSDYQDGKFQSEISPYVISQVAPFLAIKAIGTQGGRPNSAVVQAVVQFKTGNPNINGANAALFTISDVTVNAHLYYTLDGSEPSSTNANAVDLGTVATPTNVWTVSVSIQTNTWFLVRAFRDNYQPSAIVSNLFTTTAFVPNKITFGQSSGEPHSKFIARPGQYYYAPVTLNLTPGFTTMYSLQFNVTVTNGLVNTNTSLMPPAIQNGAGIDFFSMLMTSVPTDEGRYYPPAAGQWYLSLPPLRAYNLGSGTNYVSSTFVNTNNNLLGVAWIFRSGFSYLYSDPFGEVILDYDTSKQDLVSFSIAHDTLFTKAGGVVVVGAYAFQIPTNTAIGDKYFMQLGSPSATSDGVSAGIYIASPAVSQAVTVGAPTYVVGDVAPFHWLNAGDFGDTHLDNSDVQQVYQAAIVNVDMPPTNSDLYLAMDSSGRFGQWDAVNQYYTDPGAGGNLDFASQQAMWDGNDLSINTNAFGDGTLDINDLFVTFRRSLDPSLTWFKRYWTNGQFVAVTTTNYAFNTNVPHLMMSKAASTVTAKTAGTSAYLHSSINFSAGDAVVGAGQTIYIPINAQIFGDYPLRVLGLNLRVVPLDGSPAITNQVTFVPVAGLGNPDMSSTKGAADYSAAWLNSASSGLSGNASIGTLAVKIPANATSSSAYAVHFDMASGSPNGLAVFPKQTLTGLITLSSRTNSSYNDGIPDSWRLRWFGTVNNYLSLSNACASGDGVNNFKKYVAGVDPSVANNFPSVNAKTPVPAGSTAAIHWPTVSGKQYVIERSATLFPGAWTIISTNTGTGTDMEFDDNVAGQSQFYRVRILP